MIQDIKEASGDKVNIPKILKGSVYRSIYITCFRDDLNAGQQKNTIRRRERDI
jgi:hypothetical protein